ncbi:MAG: hypothetical protein HYZ13_09125 [Acidobacteria bacterium]|nr:hypothetical protein [Acidobacteriota bacterium]
MESALTEATASVEQELSTRFRVTRFRGHLGPGPVPALPKGEVAEWEGPYPWPSPLPGEGFLRLPTRVRPVVEVLGAQVVLPGGGTGRVELPATWFRFEAWAGEILLAPALGAAPLMAVGLPMTFPTLFAGRLPQSVLLAYRAGLGTTGIQRWPKLRRLVLLRAALRLLPALALEMNPGLLTSLSADGLSQARTSGYALKELDERLAIEVEELKASLLDLWEGPSLGVL